MGRKPKQPSIESQATDRHVWNSEKEVGQFLASLIRLTKARTVLEIGVFEGETSKDLIEALPKGGMYVGVDIEDLRTTESKQLFTQAGKDGKVIEFILGNSISVMPKLQKNHYDIIFIDGLHEFEHVIKEFKFAEQLITRNGLIVFHDSLHIEGVKQVVEYAAAYNYRMINIDTPEKRGIAIVTKS